MATFQNLKGDESLFQKPDSLLKDFIGVTDTFVFFCSVFLEVHLAQILDATRAQLRRTQCPESPARTARMRILRA